MRRLQQVVLMLFVAVWMTPQASHALTWEFETPGNYEGWRARGEALGGGGNYTDLCVDDGGLRITVERTPNRRNVQLLSPRLELDPSLYDRLILRVRTSNGSAMGSFGMSWLPGSLRGMSFMDIIAVGGREIAATTAPEYILWTEEWQEFQFVDFAEMKGWSGTIVRFDIYFAFREEDPEKLPEEVWIDFITLTGVGAEAIGDSAKLFPSVSTGTVFHPFAYYPVPDIMRLTSGDVDGDRDVDLIAVASHLLDRSTFKAETGFTVLFNDGRGAFFDERVYKLIEVSGGIGFPRLVDLDGDSDLDLVCLRGMRIVVLENIGNGRFVEKLSGEDKIFSPWIGDIDTDGDADVVAVAGDTPTDVVILRNRGDGTFEEPFFSAVGRFPHTLRGADVDRDGDTDLVIAVWKAQETVVLLNDGDEGFSDHGTYPVGEGPVDLEIGDFDEDGYLDVTVVNEKSNDISILLNQGDGTFAQPVSYPVGHTPFAVAVEDFNGDDHQDIVVASTGAVDVWLLLGRGDGTFWREGTYPVSGEPYDLDVADLNGDGALDVMLADVSGQNVSVLLNRAEGVTGIERESRGMSPERFALYPIYPNPFNASTTIRYDVPFAGRVQLHIYDVMGQRIRALVDETKPAGSHQVVWDGKDDAGREAASGLYLCRLGVQTEDAMAVKVKRMTLLR